MQWTLDYYIWSHSLYPFLHIFGLCLFVLRLFVCPPMFFVGFSPVNFLPLFPCHPEKREKSEIEKCLICSVSLSLPCLKTVPLETNLVPKNTDIYLCIHVYLCVIHCLLLQYTCALFLHSFVFSLNEKLILLSTYSLGRTFQCTRVISSNSNLLKHLIFTQGHHCCSKDTRERHNFDLKFVYLFILERHCTDSMVNVDVSPFDGGISLLVFLLSPFSISYFF